MTDTNDERRTYGISRIRYEALVEVGGAFGPSFEAQALDLSEGGMHLRAQHLPELGQPLTCRFDLAAGTSVLASGEVAWLDDRQGEFGLRFTELDPEGAEALKEICGPAAMPLSVDEGEVEAGPAVPTFSDGSRVRLHIDGLGSPMRARVRRANDEELVACSDLAFLQIGRPLELEHAEDGGRRAATIAAVDVEMNAEGNLPQLVVRLRYADGEDRVASGHPPLGHAERSSASVPSNPASAASPAYASVPAPRSSSSSSSASGRGAIDRERAAIASASRGAAVKLAEAAGVVGSSFAKVGPAVVSAFVRAKDTVSRLRAARAAGADTDGQGDHARLRVTSPAPGGGLHTSGRRVVRGDAEEEWNQGGSARASLASHSSSAIAALAPHKTKLMAGGVLGLAGVLLLVALHKPATPAALAAVGAPEGSAAVEAAAAAGTETNAAASASGTLASGLAPSPVTPSPVPAAAGQMTTTADELGSETNGGSGSNHAPEPVHARRTVEPFGNGPVAHGNVLHVKMDGSIEKIEGAATPNGFTVVIPGRKSIDAAGPLAQRDERIASIKITNEADSAELSVAFRDGVPNYQVRAHGSTLEIALAPLGSIAEAKHGTKERKHNGLTHKKRR